MYQIIKFELAFASDDLSRGGVATGEGPDTPNLPPIVYIILFFLKKIC